MLFICVLALFLFTQVPGGVALTAQDVIADFANCDEVALASDMKIFGKVTEMLNYKHSLTEESTLASCEEREKAVENILRNLIQCLPETYQEGIEEVKISLLDKMKAVCSDGELVKSYLEFENALKKADYQFLNCMENTKHAYRNFYNKTLQEWDIHMCCTWAQFILCKDTELDGVVDPADMDKYINREDIYWDNVVDDLCGSGRLEDMCTKIPREVPSIRNIIFTKLFADAILLQ